MELVPRSRARGPDDSLAKKRAQGRPTRGRPFEPGNPGRPKGSRHKTTLAIEQLLEGEAEALTRKVIDAALGGDTTALRLCLERLAPAPRDRPVQFAVKKSTRPPPRWPLWAM